MIWLHGLVSSGIQPNCLTVHCHELLACKHCELYKDCFVYYGGRRKDVLGNAVQAVKAIGMPSAERRAKPYGTHSFVNECCITACMNALAVNVQ